MRTRVVHVSDHEPGAVYIGRRNNRRALPGSPFANPFRVEDHGRATAIAQYRTWLIHRPELMARLPELRGQPLACWCRHDDVAPTEDTACHGDVLVELLDTYDDDALRNWRVTP